MFQYSAESYTLENHEHKNLFLSLFTQYNTGHEIHVYKLSLLSFTKFLIQFLRYLLD